MKIETVEASIHEFPILVPLIDKPIQTRRVVFCRLRSDDGVEGWGITGAFLAPSIVAALERDIRDTVTGMDPRDTEAIHSRVWKRLNPRAYTGVISNALSALDIALWDIHGKAANRSVAQLMGGFRDHAPAYVTFGNLHYDRDQLVECATLFAGKGVTRLKMEAACDGGWQEDVRRIRAVRDAIGEDVELVGEEVVGDRQHVPPLVLAAAGPFAGVHPDVHQVRDVLHAPPHAPPRRPSRA